MGERDVEFLQRLVETPSVTGAEWRVAALLRERLASTADEVVTDVMGNVRAHLRGSGGTGAAPVGASGECGGGDPAEGVGLGHRPEPGAGPEPPEPPRVLLASHMDEIGFMVTYISDEGFLSFRPVGGVDAGLLAGMRLDVHAAEGPIRGVVGRMPIHLVPADERKSVAPFDKLCIDVGLPADEVRSRVRVGDVATFAVGFERFGANLAVARAFDDKACVSIGVRVLEALAAARPQVDFTFAATVQEEIGTRGAETAAFAERPTVALGFDVTHATDYPGVEKTKHGDIKLGAGPVIARGPNINPVVFERLVAAAEAEGLAYQLEAEPGVTGTDAAPMQVSRGGIATGLVSLPLRYMHTPTEVISLDDVDACVRLISRFVADLPADASFVPGA